MKKTQLHILNKVKSHKVHFRGTLNLTCPSMGSLTKLNNTTFFSIFVRKRVICMNVIAFLDRF